MTTWQEHLKKCAKEWQEMKKKNADRAKKTAPPRVPRRVRGKQTEAARDLNLSPEKMNQPVQVVIKRCTEKYLWFESNHLQRMGRNTFDTFIQHFGYKIVSI